MNVHYKWEFERYSSSEKVKIATSLQNCKNMLQTVKCNVLYVNIK